MTIAPITVLLLKLIDSIELLSWVVLGILEDERGFFWISCLSDIVESPFRMVLKVILKVCK